MNSKAPEDAEQMYHRMYRLLKRDIDPRLIAATLNVPFRTVLSIKARLEESSARGDTGEEALAAPPQKEFLDIYTYSKIRYAILHLVGSVVETQKENLSRELEKLTASTWKAIALRMGDTTALDQVCATELISFYEKLAAHRRYVAILDPSTDIESALTELGIDGRIPVFGTERAFEEAAFSRRNASSIWRNRR